LRILIEAGSSIELTVKIVRLRM